MAKHQDEKAYWGFTITKRGRQSKEAYFEQLYKANKTKLNADYARAEEKYSKLGDEPLKQFRRQYKSAEAYFKAQVESLYERMPNIKLRSALKEYAETASLSGAQLYARNAIKALQNSFPDDWKKFTALLKAEKEKLDINKVEYIGDSTYRYVTNSGVEIFFRFATDSGEGSYTAEVWA